MSIMESTLVSRDFALPPGILAEVLIDLIREIGFAKFRALIHVPGKLRRITQFLFVGIYLNIIVVGFCEQTWRHCILLLPNFAYTSHAHDGIEDAPGLKIDNKIVELADSLVIARLNFLADEFISAFDMGQGCVS